jgi:aryl-alcohol dehydrogenase/geraniol dehydrogenase (NAD+)
MDTKTRSLPLQQAGSLRRARAAVARRQRTPLLLEDIDVAAPRADEVLVRLVAAGVCHTDLVCRDGFPVPMPIVLGHEGAGVVEEVGTAVKSVVPGDHVLLSFNSCGSCPNCQRREPAYCHQFLGLNFGGMRLEDGSSALSEAGETIHGNFFGQSSFATLAVAHEINTVPIDKSLPLAVLAPLGCGIQTGAGAVLKSLKVRPGASLVIFGGGAVGLSAVMAARVADARMIVLVEPKPNRRALALELGASHVVDPTSEIVLEALQKLGGMEYAIDTTGIPAVIGTAIDALLPNGQLGLIGVPPPEAPLPGPMMTSYVKGLGIKNIVEGDSDPKQFIPELVALHRAGRLPVDRLVQLFPFEQINEAMTASENGTVIKPVLVF